MNLLAWDLHHPFFGWLEGTVYLFPLCLLILSFACRVHDGPTFYISNTRRFAILYRPTLPNIVGEGFKRDEKANDR
jgi:hypothetical protein